MIGSGVVIVSSSSGVTFSAISLQSIPCCVSCSSSALLVDSVGVMISICFLGLPLRRLEDLCDDAVSAVWAVASVLLLLRVFV